jgi:uncharacterized protein YbaA (DUF1428 family)
MTYVDGFVLPVPSANLAAYKKLARLAAKVWKEHGALTYVECVADDAPVGAVTSFPRSVKLKEDEVVVFAWITYPLKAARNKILKKVMADPRMNPNLNAMPFDSKRMIFGGFKAVVEA